MEFIVLFEDSQTWSSDDAEYVYGNSFVIPETLFAPEEWKELMDQHVLIGEIDPPRISIPEMIRELKKAHKWDDLVDDAQIRAQLKRDSASHR